METPICDFIRRYQARDVARLHMPGHKGVPLTGTEPADITEIAGADELYRSRGIIRQSEENAAALLGAARTIYSAEGSSLCIRAMLFLASLRAAERGLPRRLLAGRNAHKTLVTAAAMLDLEIDWIYPAAEEGLLSCRVTPAAVEGMLAEQPYMAVYVTSPDYPGHMADIRGIAAACRRRGVPLLVDNAHGAYLRFLPEDLHPLTLGADMTCDSAHKTLACLTGAAYLHISREAPAGWAEQAEQAMGFFGSTSPSWLILASLDRMNAELAGSWRTGLAETVRRLETLKEKLRREGWQPVGDEPMKLAVAPRGRGLTGDRLGDLLREAGIECEFSDPDYTVLMPSPRTLERDWQRLERAMSGIDRSEALKDAPPAVPVPEKVCSIREAMLSPRETVPAEAAEGRVLADPDAGCPPAVPILMPGERISAEAVECFRYYGFDQVTVVRG
jgi:arginine/lysine/ornithine decarboxylase